MDDTSKEPASSNFLIRQEFTFSLEEALERISQADPAKVQEIAAAQVGLLDRYHKLAINQAERSFRLAFSSAIVGLLFFIGSVSFNLSRQNQDAARNSLISGALVEVIAGIQFYLYGKASLQLSAFISYLDKTQRYLIANSVCEGLDGEFKQNARSDLVRAIAGVGEKELNSPKSREEQEKS